MPDWSYQSLFRPLLFQLPSELARGFTLQAMGKLSKLPGGSLLIKTLGHMESHAILKTSRWGIDFQFPVGVSGALDIHGVAPRALAQFGLGFMEVGPVTVDPIVSSMPIQRDRDEEGIWYPDANVNDGIRAVLQRLLQKSDYPIPTMIRTRHMPGVATDVAFAQQIELIEQLSSFAAGLYIDILDEAWTLDENLMLADKLLHAAAAYAPSKPLFIYIPLDYGADELERLLSALDFQLCSGVVVGEWSRTDQGYLVGKAGKPRTVAQVAAIRSRVGVAPGIIATGGIHEPQDALDIRSAGADYVQLHSGLVYSGPGLPKRINEAIIYDKIQDPAVASGLSALPSFWRSWGWMCFLGLGMIIGGILAWAIAATNVVLPYDLAFLGLGRDSILEINERLLPFMSHDRITLAGTMISIGVMYFQLARHGLRYGLHWAKTALLVSCAVGFGSFFLFLGYGYFDPLHALMAVILFPMFVLSMLGKADRPSLERPNFANSSAWRLAQRGQLMFVILGVSLAIGGITISVIGITQVFVPTDLQYLCTTPEMLQEINDKLMPLIAHDRAGFGGALFSNALAILTMALWGINQGQRWLWWTFLFGGMPGFVAGFSVHGMIGYTDFWHLLPAYFAFAVYLAGLVLLYPYLMGRRVER
jgi:dihydroorotate dehydrogenase